MPDLFSHVKAVDYDRFMLSLFQPVARRPRWLALCAFHAEIAKLPTSISDPTIGLIRLAWWREALEELKSGIIKKRHHIVEALAEIHELPFAQMEQLLDAYEAEIEEPIAATREELERRILRTTHVLHQILYDKEVQQEESLQFGLVGFLKSIYPLARLGKPPLPRAVADPDQFGSAAYLSAVKNFTQEIAARAKDAPAPMRYYLKQAKKADYNLLQQDISSHRGIGYYFALMLRR